MIQKNKVHIRVVSDLKKLDRKILYVRYVEDEFQKYLVGFDDKQQGWAIMIEPKLRPQTPAPRRRAPRKSPKKK